MQTIKRAIITGNTEKLENSVRTGLFNKQGWFGIGNKTWFQILFQNGTTHIDEIFYLLVENSGLRVECILFEILNSQRVFVEGMKEPIDYLVNFAEYVDNTMLFEPYMLLCISGHIAEAERLRNILSLTDKLTIQNHDIFRMVKSRAGLEYFMNDIHTNMCPDDFSLILYNLLYIVRPDFPDSHNCFAQMGEWVKEIDFTQWFISCILGTNQTLPASITLYDNLIFNTIRNYFNLGDYPNMPMEANCYLDNLCFAFPTSYKRLTCVEDYEKYYYLIEGETPFVAENFHKTLNDFLDDHRVLEEDECQICFETYSMGCGIHCCLDSNFLEGHKFCEDCLRKWLNQERRTCPICRGELL